MPAMKFWPVLMFAGAACSAEHSGNTPDALVPQDAPAFVEAMPASVPQLVNMGGGVLTTPKIIPIVWANDPMKPMIEDFTNQLATSAYGTTAAGEYGVGAPTIGATITAPGTAPTTETALLNLLKTHLTSATADWPYDANAIYSVFLPPGVVLTGSDGSKSCQDYGAYHDEIPGTKAILYALMPRCSGGPGSDLDELTDSASHEWLEASTDPHVESKGAFGDSDPDHYIWAYVPGAENGDYCEYLDSAYQKLVGPYDVQRTWSNAAAKAGHDPCVPAPPTPYVAAAPIMPDMVMIDGQTGPVMTQAVKVPLNMSKTIEVQLYSDQPTDDFQVSADDLAGSFGGTAELTFTWDKTSGKNGDKLMLTITRKANGTQIPNGSEFVIVTKVGGQPVNMWWSYAAN